MGQMSFLDQPPAEPPSARATDPDTSHEAVEVNADKIKGNRLLVHNVLLQNPDSTATELCQIYCEKASKDFGEWRHEFSRRLADLSRMGVAEQSEGKRACRVKGSAMKTWKAIREITGAQIR